MTHEELLAKLLMRDTTDLYKTLTMWQKSLYAVVELHKPEGVYCFACAGSYDDAQEYPCPTIEAIEKALQ